MGTGFPKRSCFKSKKRDPETALLPGRISVPIAAPVAVAVVVTTATRARNAKNAVDCADRAADTGADCATHGPTHRTRDAVAVIRALSSASLHPAHDALRVRDMRNGEQRERQCRCCKPTRTWHLEGVCRSPDRLYLIHHRYPHP